MSRLIPSARSLRYFASCLREQPTRCSFHASTSQQRNLCSQPEPNFNSIRTYRPAAGRPTHLQYRPASGFAKDFIYKHFTLDGDIPTRLIKVRNPDGSLSESEGIATVLRSIDRQKQVLNLLHHDQDQNLAIVEIVEKQTLKDRLNTREEKAAERAKQQRQTKTKQIELNWAISGNDLQLKLKQIREFLEKGRKVEVMLAAKKRARKATPEEAQGVVTAIRKMVGELDGAREVRPLAGNIGGQAMLVIQQRMSKTDSKDDLEKETDGLDSAVNAHS